MSTITLTVEGSTIGVITVPVTLDSNQSDRVMAFLVSAYGTKTVEDETVERTPQEMVEAWWDGIIKGTLANVLNFERTEATKAAAAAVQDFNIGG